MTPSFPRTPAGWLAETAAMAVLDTRSHATAQLERRRPSQTWGRTGLLAPSAVLLLGVFLVPLGIMLWRAFTDPQPGLDNLNWYVGDFVQRTVLLRTFTAAIKVTIVCLVLGYP